MGGGIEENVEFRNEFLEGITSYLKSCNQLNFLVTRHFELVTRYAKIEFPGSGVGLVEIHIRVSCLCDLSK